MKKAISMVLCSAVMLSAMAGCSGSTGSTSNSASSTATSTAKQKDVTTLIWQYPSSGSVGSGFQDVENALNAKLEKDIGVHVKLEPVGLMDSQKKAALMISSGEQLDISLTAFTTMGPLVDAGQIKPIDDLLDKYGKDIKEQCGSLLEGCKYNGKTYGVCPAYLQGHSYGYLIRNDMMKKYGITIDQNKKYTMDDLSEIFAKVKAGEGKGFYCTIPWNTTEDPANNSYIPYDKLSGSLAGGVLMLNRSFTDLKIENLFTTPEYASYAKTMYDWTKKGYISPDAAVTTVFPDAQMSSKKYLGEFYWGDPSTEKVYGSTVGMDLTPIPMVDGYVANNGGQNIIWNIPTTTINAEKAIQTLNYIYKNKEAAWLLQYGIEGKSYDVVQKSDEGMLIKYKSADTAKLPYFQPYGIYGNRLDWPVVAPSPIDLNKQLKKGDASIPASRYSPAVGYNFVQTKVSSKIAAVDTVIKQYTPSINSGALDPEKSLPQFINALKAAGIDDIIKENQDQLNKWAANQKK